MRRSIAVSVLFAVFITAAGASDSDSLPDNLRWEAATGAGIPPTAIPGGFEAHGEVLYICRAAFQGGVHPGKASRSLGACLIAWGELEHYVDPYEVLVLAGAGTVSTEAPSPVVEREPYVSRERIARVLTEALEATTPDGGPDWATRLRAAELAIALNT